MVFSSTESKTKEAILDVKCLKRSKALSLPAEVYALWKISISITPPVANRTSPNPETLLQSPRSAVIREYGNPQKIDQLLFF